MSNDLAIAAVTATLRNLLLAGYSDMPAVTVTTRPPAQARTGSERPSQLNLFLFQTEPNAAFVNADPIGRARSGESARPSLALDLHYLITAFGEDDEEVDGHRVLGRALRVLHDHPVLRGDDISSALPGSDLADQAERVRATLLPLGIEEISKLWTAFQSEYRLSAAYRASVVLIDATTPISAPLPVLTRGPGDAGVVAQPDLTPPFPTIVTATVPEQRITAHLGDEIELSGHHLDGDTVEVVLRHPLRTDPVVVAAAAPASDSTVRFVVPDLPESIPVGVWAVAARIVRAGEPDRTTNEIPVAVAPRISSIAPNPAVRVGGDVTLTIVMRPQVRPAQRAALLLGAREVLPAAVAAPTDTLVFDVEDAAAGDHLVRLRIDGIDSNLIDRSTTPPTFDQTQRVTVT